MAAELRRRGHLLFERHYEDHFPTRWRHPFLKVARRVLRPLMASDYNRAVAELLDVGGMDFLLVFKGMLLSPRTLSRFKARLVPCYCFYPDVSFEDHGANIPACLPLYDCVFTPKSYHLADATLRTMALEWRFAPHGYDPEVHRSVSMSTRDIPYASDVSFVGQWSPKKENVLAGLRERLPGVDLKIWGTGWGDARPSVRSCWQERGAYGDELAAIYSLSRINLGLLSEAGTGSPTGDATTARTWQIPGAGGFLMHEDTPEARQSFEVGGEVALFVDAADLARQVEWFLANESVRDRVARAGHARAAAEPYTYARAVDAILARHRGGNTRR
jgi:glycosyltransferase involved in cell wall biosynthesis